MASPSRPHEKLPRVPELRPVMQAVDEVEDEIERLVAATANPGIPAAASHASPLHYAQPHHRAETRRTTDAETQPHPRGSKTKEIGELTVNAVKNFSELPTKQIDDLLAGIDDKIANIKKKAAAIKVDYATRVEDLTASINRLNEACIQSEAKMDELHSQLTDLYTGPATNPKPEEPEGDTA